MIDPMLARLACCLVFASLFAGLLAIATRDPGAPRDMVRVAEVQKSVEQVLLTRP
ncbi:hypothetical protein IHQ68_01420 [Chelatococcus sambhunathii]|uniref:Uncharacterized protein n=1 Tax=Chelatococcus sambhunathii TaxID=363953 RepID=A0ABU1DAZ6_9HYPH|nr:hypothetical protein [Chelatococcus sambhunathii]MDR4305283.1 hypothetical protein [Chelatococcus sambhunathii]